MTSWTFIRRGGITTAAWCNCLGVSRLRYTSSLAPFRVFVPIPLSPPRGQLPDRQLTRGLISIHISQWIGAPLYWVNRDLFYAYMAWTKQLFGLLITTMTHWWGPSIIRISGDASVAGQITQAPDGRVQFSFPERLVLIANHQVRDAAGDHVGRPDNG